jgi:hypothetical protein
VPINGAKCARKDRDMVHEQPCFGWRRWQLVHVRHSLTLSERTSGLKKSERHSILQNRTGAFKKSTCRAHAPPRTLYQVQTYQYFPNLLLSLIMFFKNTYQCLALRHCAFKVEYVISSDQTFSEHVCDERNGRGGSPASQSAFTRNPQNFSATFPVQDGPAHLVGTIPARAPTP